jgi:hypothetical protein
MMVLLLVMGRSSWLVADSVSTSIGAIEVSRRHANWVIDGSISRVAPAGR